ncbi:oxidoreductase FAD/NADP-binding domain containing protein [Nitzschia inconspicua]|uniref:ferredoxin--NADP(+) reductase n=1 Tax=Nitzschia inconspicua TaxID=303405 RepID=A0A9K3LPV2_9STRA|nr:oxidoreductase FAD/NADP-binding domain containing protein [Nitzschia inconspicua]
MRSSCSSFASWTATVSLLVVVVIAVSLSASFTVAFVNPVRISTSSLLSASNKISSSCLKAAPTNDRVVKAGAGVPVVPSGDCLLFDPAVEGMLGGDHSLQDRLQQGTSFVYLPATTAASTIDTTASTTTTAAATPPPNVNLIDAQAWLEQLDINGSVPPPFAKANAPVQATVLGRTKLIDDTAPGDIQHVLLRLPEGFHYVEGQSLSVIPPGVDAKTGKKHKPRLYSIASTRYGDLLDGTTVSLCVRRAEYFDPLTGTVDPTKAGVCSNFLCDLQAGQAVDVAGPVGKTMVLPQDPTKDIIMVATGTGIAPFRAFLHRLFMEDTIARHQFQGTAWLILGVPTTGGLLYKPELDAMVRNSDKINKNNLEIDYAISREMTNSVGEKLYVQHVLRQQADKLLERLENGAHIYFCGLKGMMPGILEALEQVATSRRLDWTSTLKKYQQNNQWHVEVY